MNSFQKTEKQISYVTFLFAVCAQVWRQVQTQAVPNRECQLAADTLQMWEGRESSLKKKQWVKRKEKRHSSDLHCSQKHIFPPPTPPPPNIISQHLIDSAFCSKSVLFKGNITTPGMFTYSHMLIPFVIKWREGQGRPSLSWVLHVNRASCSSQLILNLNPFSYWSEWVQTQVCTVVFLAPPFATGCSGASPRQKTEGLKAWMQCFQMSCGVCVWWVHNKTIFIQYNSAATINVLLWDFSRKFRFLWLVHQVQSCVRVCVCVHVCSLGSSWV